MPAHCSRRHLVVHFTDQTLSANNLKHLLRPRVWRRTMWYHVVTPHGLGVSVCVWGNDVYIYTHTPPTWHTHHTPVEEGDGGGTRASNKQLVRRSSVGHAKHARHGSRGHHVTCHADKIRSRACRHSDFTCTPNTTTRAVSWSSVSLSVFGGMMCISTHTPLRRGTRITPHQALCVFPPS